MELFEGGIIYKNYSIISDTHFGIEYDFIETGIYLGRISEKVVKELIEICFSKNIYKIIFLGDFKHEIFNIRLKGKEYVKDIIKRLEEHFEILIIKGNHDGNLDEIYNGKIFKRVSFGKVLLTHGHINLDINKYKTIIIGHEHPYIKISGNKFQTYVVSKNDDGKRIIILPAFNRFVGGINILDVENLSSPIFRRNFSLDNSDVILRSGYFLDKVKNLKKMMMKV